VTRLISQANDEARKTSSDNLAMDLVANCHLDRSIHLCSQFAKLKISSHIGKGGECSRGFFRTKIKIIKYFSSCAKQTLWQL
jgi:hypothetical protein